MEKRVRIDVYTEEDRNKEGRDLFKRELSHSFWIVIPFAVIFCGLGLISNYKNPQSLAVGIILLVVGLVWISYSYRIKALKLILFGIVALAGLFYTFFSPDKYSSENKIFSLIVVLLCGFLFYKEVRRRK